MLPTTPTQQSQQHYLCANLFSSLYPRTTGNTSRTVWLTVCSRNGTNEDRNQNFSEIIGLLLPMLDYIFKTRQSPRRPLPSWKLAHTLWPHLHPTSTSGGAREPSKPAAPGWRAGSTACSLTLEKTFLLPAVFWTEKVFLSFRVLLAITMFFFIKVGQPRVLLQSSQIFLLTAPPHVIKAVYDPVTL